MPPKLAEYGTLMQLPVPLSPLNVRPVPIGAAMLVSVSDPKSVPECPLPLASAIIAPALSVLPGRGVTERPVGDQPVGPADAGRPCRHSQR